MDEQQKQRILASLPAHVLERVGRSQYGLVDISELFEGFKWCRWKPTYPSHIEDAKGFNFTASGFGTMYQNRRNYIFMGRPTEMVRNDLQHLHRLSFEIIRWTQHEVAVVLARDPEWVDSAWLGFIPVEQAPNPSDFSLD